MFATHYHELCDLADRLPQAANFNVAAKEHGDTMVFLYTLVAGGSNRSYGLAVARLAGVPPVVLARAKAKLGELESENAARTQNEQLAFFVPAPVKSNEVERTLAALDVDRMTPLDALTTLARIKTIASQQVRDPDDQEEA